MNLKTKKLYTFLYVVELLAYRWLPVYNFDAAIPYEISRTVESVESAFDRPFHSCSLRSQRLRAKQNHQRQSFRKPNKL